MCRRASKRKAGRRIEEDFIDRGREEIDLLKQGLEATIEMSEPAGQDEALQQQLQEREKEVAIAEGVSER